MEFKNFKRIGQNIKDALDVQAYRKFDLYEQFVVVDLMKRGHSFAKAVELVVNSVEGDESQLSEGIKSYVKNRKGKR
jgi:hypothetical protein